MWGRLSSLPVGAAFQLLQVTLERLTYTYVRLSSLTLEFLHFVFSDVG